MAAITQANQWGASIRRLLAMAKEGPFAQGFITQSRPVSDPSHQAALTHSSFNVKPCLAEAVITDTTAVANCYRLRPEKLHYEITGTLATHSSLTSFGARQLSTLQPGTKVQIVWHPGHPYAWILGVIPFSQTEAKKAIPQQLFQTSRNRVDEAHIQPLKMGGGGFVTDWLSGRPFDGTTVGEQGWITETGSRIFIDPWLVMMGIDEACSITAFYHDQLLRLAAYNLRMFSAGMEREGLDDQGEYNDWTGFTPYPWEQMGLFERNNPSEEKQPQQWQIDQPYYGNVEPQNDDQRPWHRELEYHGYLGQGGLHIVQTMPKTPPEYAKFNPDGQDEYPGLSIFHRALDGRVLLGSAKGVSITKRVAILSPTRNYPPEQVKEEGDNPQNYKAASIVGDGPEHIIKSDIQTEGDNPELTRAAGIFDLHAYWFNYASVHPFFYHYKDWHVPDESTLQHTGGKTIQVPDYSKLESSVFLSVDDLKLDDGLKIDHRITEAAYWQTQCGLELLEDGGVVLYDGWGSELKLTAGSAWLTAPGDVWMQPGRTAVIWGGDDVVIRAQNSMDLTTTAKDIRIKAERNQHFLSGNGGEGGTLIECRAPDKFKFQGKCGEDVVSGGVFMRAEKGTVGAWATNIYLRTGGGDITGGQILLDADRGKQNVITHARQLINYLDSAAIFHWATNGEVQDSTYLSNEVSAFASDTNCFNGIGIFDGSVLIKGSFLAAEGHIATEQGCQNPFVGCLEGESLQATISAILDCVRIGEATIPLAGAEFFSSVLEPVFYDEEKPGNDDVIRDSEFSLRTEEQYGTASGFKLYEARWQQMGRKSGKVSNRWQETKVECRADPETYPYPGKKYYQGEAFVEVDNEIFEIAGDSGRAKAKGSGGELDEPYNDPKYATPSEPKGLNQYPVIRGRS